MTCDKCKYCFVKSNQIKSAKMHTIHYRCHLIDKAVNPYNSCEMWKERKGKRKIRYKNGEIMEQNEWLIDTQYWYKNYPLVSFADEKVMELELIK